MYRFNVREEKFGATIYDLMKGNRFYISIDELNSLYERMVFPKDLGYKNIKHSELRITRKNNKESPNVESNLWCTGSFLFASRSWLNVLAYGYVLFISITSSLIGSLSKKNCSDKDCSFIDI